MPRPGVLLAAAIALVALAYGNSLHGPFIWDDYVLIVDQPFVHQIQPLHEYFIEHTFWSTPDTKDPLPYYRPLTVFSYSLDYALWGERPAGFHATNLLLHLIACALVFALCRRGGASALSAAIATVLFGTLPRLTESVTWISGRTDVLAAVGVLAALAIHRSEPRRTLARVFAALALLAALFSKEVALAGFAALVALEALPALQRDRSWGRAALNLAPAVAVTALYLGLHFVLAPPFQSPEQPPLGVRLVLPFQSLGHYVVMLLDPLQPRLRLGTIGVSEPGFTALGFLAAGGLAILGIQILRGRIRGISAVAMVLAVASLGLVLHVLPLWADVIAADRFLYLPAAGLAVAGGIEASRLRVRMPSVVAGVLVVVMASFVVGTELRNQDWGDEMRLWTTAVRNAPPEDPLPEASLGAVLLADGKASEALPHLRAALAINRESRGLHPWKKGVPREVIGDLAVALAQVGQPDKARHILETLVRLEPHVPLHRFNLALLDARELRFQDARRELREALHLQPDYPAAKNLLSQVEKAESLWKTLPPARPDEPVSVTATRAEVYARVGRSDAAALWARVAADPQASPNDVRRAALFLTERGDPAAAKQAIQRFAKLSPKSQEPAALAAALRARESEDSETAQASAP